jgi:hypothetical protein
MQLAATQRTPLIEISATNCRIVGECYPENIQEFSSPVMTELKDAVPDSGEYKVELELFYFNSSSAKFFFDFFEFFEERAEAGVSVSVNWNYRADDDTMLEAGEDFAEDMIQCKFELVEMPSEAGADAEDE